MTLTIEKIHAIADALVANGTKPTLANVRKELGSGSFTTIGEAMKTWRQEQKTEQALQQTEYPDAIDDKLRSLGASVWQLSMEMADGRLKVEREALAVAQDDAQSQIDEAQEAVKILETERADLLKDFDALSNSTERAIADAKDSQSNCEALTAENNELKISMARNEGKLEVMEEQVKTITADRNELNSANKTLAIEVSKLKRDNQQLNSSH